VIPVPSEVAESHIGHFGPGVEGSPSCFDMLIFLTPPTYLNVLDSLADLLDVFKLVSRSVGRVSSFLNGWIMGVKVYFNGDQWTTNDWEKSARDSFAVKVGECAEPNLLFVRWVLHKPPQSESSWKWKWTKVKENASHNKDFIRNLLESCEDHKPRLAVIFGIFQTLFINLVDEMIKSDGFCDDCTSTFFLWYWNTIIWDNLASFQPSFTQKPRRSPLWEALRWWSIEPKPKRDLAQVIW